MSQKRSNLVVTTGILAIIAVAIYAFRFWFFPHKLDRWLKLYDQGGPWGVAIYVGALAAWIFFLLGLWRFIQTGRTHGFAISAMIAAPVAIAALIYWPTLSRSFVEIPSEQWMELAAVWVIGSIAVIWLRTLGEAGERKILD